MPDYQAHVMVCTNRDDPEDTRHCGGKNGPAVRQRFNELLVKHKLIEKVTISNVGCTSQHRLCESSQGTVIVYGPSHELGRDVVRRLARRRGGDHHRAPH